MHHLTTLRTAQIEDTEALLTVWQRAVEATRRFLSPADLAGVERVIKAAALGRLAVTVAERDGTIVGFVGIPTPADGAGPDDGTPLSVEMLFVDPDHQRQGIGAALLDHVLGLVAPALVDVPDQDPAVVDFYLGRGFEVIGRSQHLVEDVPVRMLHLRRA